MYMYLLELRYNLHTCAHGEKTNELLSVYIPEMHVAM